jgi:hypothetical protein
MILLASASNKFMVANEFLVNLAIRIASAMARDGWLIGELRRGMAGCFELHDRRTARPAMFERLFCAPEPLRGAVRFVEPCHEVRPWTHPVQAIVIATVPVAFITSVP